MIKHVAFETSVNLGRKSFSTFDLKVQKEFAFNIPEKQQALCEIYRVLKKDKKSIDQSKLAILEVSECFVISYAFAVYPTNQLYHQVNQINTKKSYVFLNPSLIVLRTRK